MAIIKAKDSIYLGKDQKYRCYWCNGSDIYENYHDFEWGRCPKDDFSLFQDISLEIFQAGLSWLTILKKRDALIEAFDGFDFYKISNYNQTKLNELLLNPLIIRHPAKIKAIINNAAAAVTMRAELGSLVKWVWQFKAVSAYRVDNSNQQCSYIEDIDQAVPLLNALKLRGWKFIGLKNIYAFMQAIGLVNAHLPGCFCLSDRANYDK